MVEIGRSGNSNLLINVCIDQLNLGEQKNVFFAQNKASKPCLVGKVSNQNYVKI